jgi:glycosyltransferase involved in cell wall biosynthesis
MMKFLFVLLNLQGGGAERAILNFAGGLAGRGHQVHVVLLEHTGVYAAPEAITLHALTREGISASSGWIGKRLAAWKLRRLYNRLTQDAPFDVTVSTLPFADEVVWLAGLPGSWSRIANTLSAEIAAMTDKRKAARRLARYRRLYQGQRLIAVSAGVAADLRTKMEFTNAKIVTIYNPFDLVAIRRQARAAEADLPDEPYFVHAGRFQRQKRHDVLLDAYKASALPHRLVLLTERSDELMQLIISKQLEHRVLIAGFRKNPFPWYANAAAVVLSSEREGMPNVLVEALTCGTPVISTDCPFGPREVIGEHMSHWLVPTGDVATMAARMREIVQARPVIPGGLLERFSINASLDAIEGLARVDWSQP